MSQAIQDNATLQGRLDELEKEFVELRNRVMRSRRLGRPHTLHGV